MQSIIDISKHGKVSGESLRQFCQGQIARFKIPTHFKIVDELLMTITGKPQKFVMCDMIIVSITGQVASSS